MIRTAVKSKNLKSVGYDPTTSILEIEFNSGGIYTYDSVPQEIHDALMQAQSKGSYFHTNIRKKFAYKRVE
jgi:hypothetical protein